MSEAADARLVRDALIALSSHPVAGSVRPTLQDVALHGSDELLAKLRRLLK